MDEIETKKVISFSCLCKPVLVPVEHKILIVPFFQFQECYEVLYKAGLNVIPYPYGLRKTPTVFQEERQNVLHNPGTLMSSYVGKTVSIATFRPM